MQYLFFKASTIKVTFPRTVVVNKVVIVNVRATAQDHVRDHPCHPPHGRQTGRKKWRITATFPQAPKWQQP